MTHVYRNRADDQRDISELYYCKPCDGYYGVPHTNSHCQNGQTARWNHDACACRPCREASGRPVEGAFGVTLASEVTP